MGEQATLLDHVDTPAVRRAHEADFSPPGLVVDLLIALDALLVSPPRAILAPCAGPGIFGQVECELWPNAERIGAELRPTETGGGHYHRYRAGVRAEEMIRDRGLWSPGDLEHVDAVVDNPAFKLAFERGDGKGKARVARPCLLDLLRDHMPGVRLVALLGRTQWGQRGDGRTILADHRPRVQLRATAPAACRGGSATDQDDYSLWCWGDRSLFRFGCSTIGWAADNVPALSTVGKCYRWEGGRPGDVPLSPALVERLHAARARRRAAA